LAFPRDELRLQPSGTATREKIASNNPEHEPCQFFTRRFSVKKHSNDAFIHLHACICHLLHQIETKSKRKKARLNLSRAFNGYRTFMVA
jgi:hypothetical protein